jgi:hypothetical protein
MKPKNEEFPIDGEFLMILPKAGSSLKSALKKPILHSDEKGHFIEMKIKADPNNPNEVDVTRRIPLENYTEQEWESLKSQIAQMDMQTCLEQGIHKTLERIEDIKLQRLLSSFLTFLNPFQIAIIFYLYREAEKQKNGPRIYFRSNELLEWLGYKKEANGSFSSDARSQLHRDLFSMDSTYLFFAQPRQRGKKLGAQVLVKKILVIEGYEIDTLPREFDLIDAVSSYGSADSYTVSLGFFEGLSPLSQSNRVYFPGNISFKRKQGSRAKYDYRTKLLSLLASHMAWELLIDGQFLDIPKENILKNLDLSGSNPSRNNQIFWRTVDELKEEGLVLNAEERKMPDKQIIIRFGINSEMLHSD